MKGLFVTLALTTMMVGSPSAAQSYSAEDLDADFERSTLIIRAAEHACHKFDVWLAISRPQLSRGLMFVRELAPDTGMLFLYAEPHRASMWMKNTFISLDILFIRADGTISSIQRNTEPQSLRSIAAIEPVSFVLELGAGVTAALGIEPGDQMIWTDSL